MKDRMEEFENECIDEGDAKRIDGVSKSKEAERFENQSDYHLKAAEELIGSEADLIAIVEGYYSMLHKANQALALAGFKADTHKCTLLGLRGVFQESDLAKSLQESFDERINVDYYMNPDKPDLKEFKNPEIFVEETVMPFREQIDDIIESDDL